MYALYSALLGLFLLLTLPYWLLQMLRHGKYRAGLAQRLGRFLPRSRPPTQPTIWVHAVSVGEVVAASGVVAGLKEKFPFHRVLVSTTTSTGQKLAARRFGAENVFYFPLDFGFAIRPWLAALRPELVVLAETEFWPISSADQTRRGRPRRDQRPHLRPFALRLQAAPILASEGSRSGHAVPCPD